MALREDASNPGRRQIVNEIVVPAGAGIAMMPWAPAKPAQPSIGRLFGRRNKGASGTVCRSSQEME